MKPSQIAALLIIIAAAIWIGSGMIRGDRSADGFSDTQENEKKPLFKVTVQTIKNEGHARHVMLSGHTEADRRIDVVARTSGVIERLIIRRGATVKRGAKIAILSDEAREALVEQAKARLEQRRSELKARLKLISTGDLPKLQKPALEADLRAAEAAYAQAEAERNRNVICAPFDGIVNALHVREGQALQIGSRIAEIVSFTPMLAIVEIAERELGNVKIGDPALISFSNGETAAGKVRFISAVASPQTRTYRVDVEMEGNDLLIPDGITCEVTLTLTRIQAASVPRSSLVFSPSGQLGLRYVEADDRVNFSPIKLVEDEREYVWVAGVPSETRIIIRGQDFVSEGQVVEPISAPSQGDQNG